MGQCYITRRGTKTGGATEQLGIYPVGNDGRPMGNVVVPNSVSVLSDYIFQNNANILTVVFGTDLYKINDNAFQKCTSLQEIKIPNEVSAIPQYCFDGCTSMSKIALPKNLTEISSYAFQNCSTLRTITIPDEVTNLVIKGYAFKGCSSLTNETVSKLAQLVQGSVYTYAFCGLTGITEVTTSYTNDYYFSDCTNLKKVTILNSLSDGSFGQYVFYKCTNLIEVVLPNTAKIINRYMFSGNSKLSIINIPKSVTQIGAGAFENCTRLNNLDIDENASFALGDSCFHNTRITDSCAKNIIEHALSIGDNVFRSCSSLINVELPVFSRYMFNSCSNLKTAVSTKAAESTGDEVFYDCYALTKVVIADGTKNIGSCIFDGCNSLKEVYLPSSIITATNSSLTTTSGSYYAFYNCTALEDVRLGQDWNMSLRLNVSNNLTVGSMVAMFNSLKDLTGDTAKTLTLGSTNLAKLTDEQKAIAINKNWTLA